MLVTGTFFWAWSSEVLQGGVCDESFTLAGKPAAAVCKKYFEKLRQARRLGKPSQQLLQAVAPTEVYSDGKLGQGWTASSWDGVFTVASTDPPLLPTHTSAYKGVMKMWGAVAFEAASYKPPATAPTELSFYLRSDSPLDTINLGAMSHQNCPLFCPLLPSCVRWK